MEPFYVISLVVFLHVKTSPLLGQLVFLRRMLQGCFCSRQNEKYDFTSLNFNFWVTYSFKRLFVMAKVRVMV